MVLPEQIQPGDFFVTATYGRLLDRMVAGAIRRATARRRHGRWVPARFNHAGIYIGHGTIIEAAGRVRYGEIEQYPDAAWSTKRLPAHLTPTDAQRVEIVNAALHMIGDRYNWLDLAAIDLAQARMGHLVTDDTWWARRLSHDGREICSQVVDVAYLHAGIHLFDDGRLPGLVSPQDLGDLLLPER